MTAMVAAARSVREICEDARRGQCGYCRALPGEPCAVSGTGPDGYHVARFAWAEACGLISAEDFNMVVVGGPFTNTTVIYDTGRRDSMSSALGPFETSSDALLALRPGNGSFLGREARIDVLTETLHAAGVELGEWDRTILRWLADLDVQTLAPIAGWVSRARRQPVSGVVAQALADAIAYRTALTSGCPDCAAAVPEGALTTANMPHAPQIMSAFCAPA